MRTYGQFCPVARASELLAERWTPIIIRNLLNGCRTFSEIRQGAPGIPTALLTSRLNSLERHGDPRTRARPIRAWLVLPADRAKARTSRPCAMLWDSGVPDGWRSSRTTGIR